jgi:steroid 5-alpha reductase family enzyme
MNNGDPPRAAAFAWVTLAYLVALAAAAWIHGRLSGQPALVAIGAADLLATLVVFGFSMTFDNSSFYDPYWSVAPPLIGLSLVLCHAVPEVPLTRQVLVLGVVTAWGARLTWNWIRGWRGLGHEDFRYVDLRRQTGRAYPLVSLFGLHLMPTVTVFLGCLPLVPVLSTKKHAPCLNAWLA